jgi:L-threonylcarbamoyladenylate synthase
LTVLYLRPYLDVLARGGVVACPTETFFGLLADASSADAVERVCEIKGRPASMPIALLTPSLEVCARFVSTVPASAARLAALHWPGPLTLLLPAAHDVHRALVQDGKLGVRVPGPSIALDLVNAFGRPLTATSANPSGQPAAMTAEQAQAYFGQTVDAIVPGESPGGLASTLVDCTGAQPVVLRRGPIDIKP